MVSRGAQIALVALTTALMLVTLAVNFLSFSPLGRSLGLFSNASDSVWTNRSNRTQSILTPPEYAFGIWGFIYVYQLMMLAYCWSLLFRRSRNAVPLCCIPGLLPAGFLICHSLSSVLNTTFVLLADRTDSECTLIALVFVMLLIASSLSAGLIFSFHELSANRCRLHQEGLQTDCWLVIALLQNSCGFYVGWAWMATFINVDNAVINLASYSVSSSSMLSLCQVCGLLAAFVTADFSFLDPHVRFFFGPYLTLLWALATGVAGSFRADSVTSAVSVELVAVLTAVLIVKLVLAVVRQKKNPLPGPGESSGLHKKNS